MSTKSFFKHPDRSRLFEAVREKFSDRVLFNETLAPHLFYRVGGPADILVFPIVEGELDWLADLARRYSIPVTPIGTGSNLLVRDEGIRGLTLSLAYTHKEIEVVHQTPQQTVVRVGGGVEKPTLLEWAIQHSLGGLEFSAGVPGTIGGGIYMNAGTKYGCYGDILQRLRVFDFKNGGRQFDRQEMEFNYRSQSVVRDSLVVWAEFVLSPGEPVAMRTEVDRIIAERASKQPLDFPSCGSTFKNPVGYSAGRLIEKAGLKGLTIGNAEISLKHANFILNKGNARAADILQLIAIIKDRVLEKFNVELECEVIVLPRDQHGTGC